MQRRFGETVVCRFVDVDSSEAMAHPSLRERLRKKRLRLPVVTIGGTLRYHGVFSPTFIQRDVKALLDARGGHERVHTRPRVSARRVDVLGRAGFATAVVRSKG